MRDSPDNYRWLVEYTLAATAEFKRRNGQEHKSGIMVGEKLRKPPRNYEDTTLGLTPVRLAIAPAYRINEGKNWREVIAAYRWYYCVDKLFFDSDKTNWFEWNRWHNAYPPEWFVSFWEERGLVLVEDGNNFSMRVPK